MVIRIHKTDIHSGGGIKTCIAGCRKTGIRLMDHANT